MERDERPRDRERKTEIERHNNFQSFFDDLEYKIETVSDLIDGVNLGKLVEVACSLGRSTVMSKLRNPGGDRLRKISNVTTVLNLATKAGVDVGSAIVFLREKSGFYRDQARSYRSRT